MKQVSPSLGPLIGQPTEPRPKETPRSNEDKNIISKVPLDTKGKNKQIRLRDKLKNQQSRDKDIEKRRQKIDVSGMKYRLVGMDGAEIIGLMGFPAFRRLEPPARIWQYRTIVCVVNIFLYETDKNVTAEYVESLGKNNTIVDEDDCFRSILQMKVI